MTKKSHNCGELRSSTIGNTVTLVGWVQSARDHGGVIFIDLRDREGITQIVFRPEVNAELAKVSHSLRDEDVICVTGKVAQRLEGTTNSQISTGEIEVVAESLEIINAAKVLPFPLDRELSNEDLRMQYRYLDLRRSKMRANLQRRHRAAKIIRDYLDESGYWEIETPILSKSTPEGARDFLVPSRLAPGEFYALPQAPQQYKQLLMVSGVERYFQIAHCFRDEDLRADRQPEFTQVDIEASFVDSDDIINLIEGMITRVHSEILSVDLNVPFERMTYFEAMDCYGSDKPDRRFGLELIDVSDIFSESKFKVFSSAVSSGGVVKAMNAKGLAKITTGQINHLTETAIQFGAKGLAYIKAENGEWKSPIVKFLSEKEREKLADKLDIEDGDLVLFGADNWRGVCEVLGRIRLEAAELLELPTADSPIDCLWVTDFPLVDYDDEAERWGAVHHPFTRPITEDEALLDEPSAYGKIRAAAYDLVINGFEAGGGSLRIHESDLQRKMFSVLGITPEEQDTQFGHLLDALSFGAPPHGGFALGFDRFVAHLCGENSIREVMAFPKNNRGVDLMTGSPAPATAIQLRDLKLQSTAKKKE